jgi:NIPSNAP
MGCCPVVELRQYTLRPGQRDVLVDLFDREFVETQEAVGMEIVGQFRDLDRPDRYVWIRGFPDMDRRRVSLEAFYGGPVWAAHRDAANATMVDVDDVLLLRPLSPATGFGPEPERPALAEDRPAALVVVTVCSLDRPADPSTVAEGVLPALAAAASPPLATFVEEPSENTFPALPVRTGEHVVVWVQRFAADGAAADESLAAVRDVAAEHLPDLVAPLVQLRLQPTPRSRLR